MNAKEQEQAARSVDVTRSTIVVKSDRIELVNPVIELQGHIFVDPKDSRTQGKKLTPRRAYIAQGILVIEELGLWVPVTYASVGRMDAVK